MFYKLRPIAYQTNGSPIKGITIPQEIAIFFDGVQFTIEKSGNSIILTSGGFLEMNSKQLEKYKFEDCRI